MSNSEPIEESKQINPDVPYWSKRSNIAPIKSEYVIWSKFEKDSLREGDEGDDGRRDDELEAEGGNRKKRKSNLIDNETNETNEQENSKKNETENEKIDEVESTDIQEEKKIKLTKSQKKQRAIEARKQSKGKGGMNKARSFLKTQEMISVQLCSFVSVEKECTRGFQENQNPLETQKQEQKQEQQQDPAQQEHKQEQEQVQKAEKQQGQPKCKFNHDIKSYMQEKSNDIKSFIGQDLTKFSDEEIQQVLSNQETNVLNSPNWTTKCPLFENSGTCTFGYRCKFLSSHLENVSPGSGYQGTNHKLLIDSSKFHQREKFDELNGLPFEMIRKIRKKLYDLPLTKSYLDSIGELIDQRQFDEKGRLMASKPNRKSNQKPTITSINQTEKNQKVIDENEVNETKEIKPVQLSTESYQDAQKDLPVDLTPIRSNEKTRLNWREKLYLAPLTTVGNLPFRRLCSTLGCEITCGEMALCQDLIGANTNEWSLVKRHPSEKIFGVQVAGSRPQLLVPAAEMIGNELKVDFVDVNCGCPIDLVFKKGSGAALLEHTQRLGKSLIGMSKVLREIPLTIKLRTGITEGKNLAHKIIPQLQHWGVGATTLHGRSRQQRYSKRADWNYISECVKTLHRTFEEEPDLPQIPIFGNGDCYDYREYYENMEMSGVDGIMIARGALTKPWIFTEIKERRDWDISSRERLDQIGKLASFGLEHWGSDTQGVNTTRRFLCESLGFQYRYVPVGLLERLPARINDRPYPFKGRDELETLLASGSSKDWVKISELFLGPTPKDWNFIPKHKSNAYEEGNG